MPLKQLPLALAMIFSRITISALAQEQNVQFNELANINGDMELNRLTFPDNSVIETFSQTQRQLIVNQVQPAAQPNQVVGSTGEPFVQLSDSALTIQTNDATDLVGGQLIMPFDAAALAQQQIDPDNTFVAKLSPDRQSWVILENERSVNVGEANVRMVRMTDIDGEYIVLGRQTDEMGASLVPFGLDDADNVVEIAGTGLQEVEFQDGFRISIRANQPMTLQADVVNGISANQISGSSQPVNNYRYLVTSNLAGVVPDLNRMAAVVQLPLNAQRVMQSAQQMGVASDGRIALSVEQRSVLQNPGGIVGQLQAPAKKRQEEEEAQEGEDEQGEEQEEAQNEEEGQVEEDEQDEGEQGQGEGAEQGQEEAQEEEQAQQPPPAITQALLEPTFTPIPRQNVLDSESGRIAVPVDQVDGEFIIVMQPSGQAQQEQPGQIAGEQAAGGQSSEQQQQPAVKRQEEEGTSDAADGQQNAIIMSMAELSAMTTRQQAGNAWVGVMLDQYVSEVTGQPIPDRQPATKRSQLPSQVASGKLAKFVEKRSRALRRTTRRVRLAL